MYRSDRPSAPGYWTSPNPNRVPNFAFTIVSPRALTPFPSSFSSLPLSTVQPTNSATGITRRFWLLYAM